MLMGVKSANVVGPLDFSSMQYLSSYNFKNSTYIPPLSSYYSK